MSSRTVSVALQAKVDQYLAAMAAAAKGADDVAKAAESAGKKVDESTKGASLAFADLSKQVGISVGESAGAAQKLSGVGAQWQKLQHTAVENKEAWNDVSGGLLKSGAAAGVAVALVTREYANFDQAMSGVASTGDDARQNIDALTEAAKKAGADTAYSAVEAANGVEELVRAGVSASDVLGGGLDGALSLAAAGQIEVAEAAGIASTAMTQFELSGDKIPHVADLLAAGAGKAMGGVDDLGMALKQSGLVASQFGLSVEETVGGLSAFASAGLLGSDAGTSLKSMLLALANPAGATAKKMEELGISAYDAQGQFIGLEGLAGVLQERLGGLSDAQRQQALAQIFGNDAVRAASILYEQGAEGIANWTAAVDDSGYAAETAATLQDNLRGDLEKLGGAFSTLAIEAGEAGNGPLRTLVQSLTGIVDLAGQYPAAAQGILGVVAGLSGLALVTGGLMKGVTFVAEFKSSLDSLSQTSPGVAALDGKLGGLAKTAGIAAVALVGLSVLGALQGQLDGVTTSAEEMANALDRVKQGTGSLDAAFEGSGRAVFGAGVEDLKGAFDVINGFDGAGKIQFQFDSMMASLTGLKTTGVQVSERFAEFDRQLASMDTEQAASMFREAASAAEAEGVSVESLLTLFPQYAAGVDGVAASSGYAKLSTEQLFEAMTTGQIPASAAMSAFTGLSDSVLAAAEAALAAGGAQTELGTGAQVTAEQIEAASQAASDAISSYQGLRDAVQAVNDAQRQGAALNMDEQAASDQWIATLAATKTQVDEFGTSLDANSEKGRANREFLRGMADDALTYRDAMIANGTSVDVANAAMSAMQIQFLQQVEAFGGAEAAARQLGVGVEDLAAFYGLLPTSVETVMVTQGFDVSKEEAVSLNEQLKGLPTDIQTLIATIASTEGAEAAQEALDSIPPETLKQLTIDPDTTGATQVEGAIDGIPNSTTKDVVVDGDASGAYEAKAAIDAVQSKTVTVTTRFIDLHSSNAGAPPLSLARREADGGVLDFYARGGIRENHVAQIAPAGSWRVWAEPETGGEAYIPLAAAKRIRSLEIWRETGRRLGVTGPQYFADGGVIGQHATTGALSRPGDSYASVTNVTHQYHFEGREALGWLTDHLRDGQRRSYQTGGVHG